MASAHPIAIDPDSTSRGPTPLIIFPHSPSASHHSTRAVPIPIQGKSDHLDTPTTHISSFATHTLRANPAHSLQTTLKGMRPFLSSYQQMLERLRAGSMQGSSMVTVRPTSQPDLAKLKVDELEVEICALCRTEKDKGEMEMRELAAWGLQWVCKERCQVEVDEEVEAEIEAEVGSPNVGRDETGRAREEPRGPKGPD